MAKISTDTSIMKQAIITFLILIIVVNISFADEISSFTASVDKKQVGVGENIQLSIEVSGSSSNFPNPTLPPLPDFKIYSSGTSSSISIVNGEMSSSRTYKYVLSPQKEGTLTIGEITLKYQGNTHKTKPIQITVSKGSSPTPSSKPSQSKSQSSKSSTAANQPTGKFFAEMVVNKPKAYVNEQVTLIMRYYRAISRGANYTPPELEGFWTQDLPPEKQYYKVINNRRYLVSELRTALFPTSAGKFTIGSATIEVPGGFFERGTTLRTKPVSVTVLSLPEAGKPADFSGAVGQYSISATVDKTNPKANEPIELSIIVSGTGNIETVQIPELDDLPNFKTYESGSSTDTNTDNYVISGKKTYEVVLIPKRTGNYTIPSLSLSYFDPESKRYKTTKTNSIDITVAGIAETDDSGMSTQQEVRQLAKDILFIKPVPEKLEDDGDILYRKRGIWIIAILPIVGLIFSLIYQKHREKLQTDLGYARYKRATKMAKKRLKTAEEKLIQGSDKEFYTEIHKAIYQYIADKSNAPIAKFTSSEAISNLLEEKDFPEDVIAQTQSILEECEIARFSPTELDKEERHKLLTKAETIIVELDKHWS